MYAIRSYYAVITNAQMALHQRDRRTTRAQHDLHRLIVERVLLAAALSRSPALATGGGLDDLLDVV